MAAAQTAHLLLPQPHNPTHKAKSKEPFFANAIFHLILY